MSAFRVAENVVAVASRPESFRFPRSARLLKAAQYQVVLRHGRRLARGAWFQLLFAAPAAEQAVAGARLGLIVGKRNAPLAVSRNAIKRIWREAFRVHHAGLPAGDYVVRLQARIPQVSLTALKAQAAAEAGRLLLQAARLPEGKHRSGGKSASAEAAPEGAPRPAASPRGGA